MILFSMPTFENFIVGKGNKAAFLAAQEVGKSPGKRYNPLFIYGGTGTGKSHLLKAVTEEITRNDPSASIYIEAYCAFSEQLEYAQEMGELDRFREEFSTADAFLLDDVRNDELWISVQLELLGWIDRPRNGERQIVFTSTEPLLKLIPLEEKFLSRFQRGLVVRIEGGDSRIKEAIVSLVVEEEGIEIEADALEYLKEFPIIDVREFIGIVNRLVIDLKLEDARLTKRWLIRALQMLMKRCEVRRFRISPEERSRSREYDGFDEPKEEAVRGEVTSGDFDFSGHFPERSEREGTVEESEDVESSPAVEVVRVTGEGEKEMKSEAGDNEETLEVDEAEGFIMEWDRELDRLLNEL